MTEQDDLNRLKFIKDYLKLIHLYPEEFEEKLGEKGVRDLIDDLLDEMNFRINKINKDENK